MPSPKPPIRVVHPAHIEQGSDAASVFDLARELGLALGPPPDGQAPADETLVLLDLVSVNPSPRARPLGRWAAAPR